MRKRIGWQKKERVFYKRLAGKEKRMKRRRLFLAAGIVVILLFLALFVIWMQYREAPLHEQIIPYQDAQEEQVGSKGAGDKTSTEISLSELSEKQITQEEVKNWFSAWSKKHQSLWIHPGYWIQTSEILSFNMLEKNVFQLNVRIVPRFFSHEKLSFSIEDLLRDENEKALYAEWVMRVIPEQKGYVIEEVMRPAAYQLQQEGPMPAEEPERKPDLSTPDTYRIAQGILSITYDGGAHWQEVPVGQQEIVGDRVELFPHSFVIQKDFTGFLGFQNRKAVLYFSQDAGKSWQTAEIGQGYEAASHLSVTENAVYAAVAADRAAGSDYYAVYQADRSDLSTWTSRSLTPALLSNLTMAEWEDDSHAVFGSEGSLYYTDDGQTLQRMDIPDEPSSVQKFGISVFDTPSEARFLDNGIELSISQGSDPDYTIDGIVVNAVFLFHPESGQLEFLRLEKDKKAEPVG